MEIQELDCSVCIERLTEAGHTRNCQKVKNCIISLGRNEFREIIVKISPVTGCGPHQEIVMKEVTLFKKFLRDGKSTIRCQNRVQLLISNCPPDRLARFLKTLAVKTGIKKTHICDRVKLSRPRPKGFESISPLTEKECQSYLEMQKPTIGANKANDSNLGHSIVTPKRKRLCDNSLGLPKKRLNCTLVHANAKSFSVSTKQEISKLTKEQCMVLEAVQQGSSIFFTGSAGTGKSFLLKRIVGSLPPSATVICGSTGVAASHIGGITLHSFAGIGDGKASLEVCYKLASRPVVQRQWSRCQYLIIDEISMIEGSYFDKIEAVARHIKKCNRPFGGIQLILSGDFLQLPPVSKGTKENNRFCFQSESWKRCISSVFELTEVKRQIDADFVNILQHLRVGKCPDNTFEKLRKTSAHAIEFHGIKATKLCTHKDDVEEVNNIELRNLKGEAKVFFSVDSDTSYSDKMDKLLPIKNRVELKVGAQVMLTKNLDVRRGLVNGARGVVKKFHSDQICTPVVTFVNGVELTLKTERFSLALPGGGVATRRQYPLKLAWAVSIHKSQGLTLDCVEVSLARVFEHGQAYVALSRAKSMKGLRVLDLEKDCFRAHPDALLFYIKMRRELRIRNNFLDDN